MWIRGLAARMPFYRFMEIRLVRLGWGRSEITMKVTERLTQNAGVAHGGVCASLIDSAVGIAICTMIDKGDAITTVDLQVSFLAPAKPGPLNARGETVHMGKRIAVGDAKVTDENGKLVAKGNATYMILKNRNTNI